MAAVIPSKILGLQGQCVSVLSATRPTAGSYCTVTGRDRRFVPVDHRTGSRGTVDRHMERLWFVEPGHGFTRRFARFVSQLARHMSIAALAVYTGLAWRTHGQGHG